MATQIIPIKSTVAGKIPLPADLALGGISINHTDRKLYARNPATGEVYKLAGVRDTPTRVEFFDIIGDHLYYGKLDYTDFPATGSIFTADLWDITRTTTDSAGNVLSEQSATGAWNNKTELSYT